MLQEGLLGVQGLCLIPNPNPLVYTFPLKAELQETALSCQGRSGQAGMSIPRSESFGSPRCWRTLGPPSGSTSKWGLTVAHFQPLLPCGFPCGFPPQCRLCRFLALGPRSTHLRNSVGQGPLRVFVLRVCVRHGSREPGIWNRARFQRVLVMVSGS